MPPTPFDKMVGPFVGVRDAVELAAQDASRASLMTNCAVPIPEIGSDVWQRAGVNLRTIPASVSSTVMSGPARAMIGAISSTGAFVNYILYRCSVDGSTPTTNYYRTDGGALTRYTLVKYVSPSTYTDAIVSGGSVLLGNPSPTENRVFSLSLATKLVLYPSGATGTAPVMFDTTSGAIALMGGAVGLLYGRPTVYYGCAFFILNSDKTTIVWSAPNDVTIGYQQAGYANFWTLRQTSNAPIIALAGTNDYLYVFRINSITSLRGAPNIDFSAAASLEGISTRTGTLAPDSVVQVENTVWFLDQFARPHKIQPGRGLVPLWPNCANQCRLADLTAATQFGNWGRHIPETELVVFRVAQTSGNPVLMVFSSRTDEYLGLWSVSGFTTMDYGAIFYDETGRPMLVTTNNTSVNTFAAQKSDSATDQRDELATTAFPSFALKTPRIQGDIDMAIVPSRVTVSTQQINSVQATVKVSYTGSLTAATQAATMQQTNTTVNQQPGRASADLGVDPSGSTPYNGRDRYGQLTFTNDTADASTSARIAIGQVRVEGTTRRMDPTYA